MNYEQINMGSYNLHIIKATKFKTITVEVNFRRKLKKEEITLRNLLKSILLYTTKDFKSINGNIYINSFTKGHAPLSKTKEELESEDLLIKPQNQKTL